MMQVSTYYVQIVTLFQSSQNHAVTDQGQPSMRVCKNKLQQINAVNVNVLSCWCWGRQSIFLKRVCIKKFNWLMDRLFLFRLVAFNVIYACSGMGSMIVICCWELIWHVLPNVCFFKNIIRKIIIFNSANPLWTVYIVVINSKVIGWFRATSWADSKWV